MGQWWEDKPMADTNPGDSQSGESTVLDIGYGLLLTEPACTHTERGQTSEKA